MNRPSTKVVVSMTAPACDFLLWSLARSQVGLLKCCKRRNMCGDLIKAGGPFATSRFRCPLAAAGAESFFNVSMKEERRFLSLSRVLNTPV